MNYMYTNVWYVCYLIFIGYDDQFKKVLLL